MHFDIGLFAAVGFVFAAYAVVGNDALQTLGTFINSNNRVHWFILFLFAGLILVVTFTVGWVLHDGDPSWGRLANRVKYPEIDVAWYHTLPPLVLLIITRFGVPVSTSFMVLTVFATVAGLSSMLQKSLIGYGLAFAVGLGVYIVLSRRLETFFAQHAAGTKAPWGLATLMGLLIAAAIYYVPPLLNPEISYSAKACIGIAIIGVAIDIIASIAVIQFQRTRTALLMCLSISVFLAVVLALYIPDHAYRFLWVGGGMLATLAVLYLLATRLTSGRVVYWIILQWVTTGYLWGVWLIQDFANIFVFLPRELSALEGFGAMGIMLVLLGYTFWNMGGPVQKILRSKTAVQDIRSATVIDFLYASLLFLFKEVSDIPMSTTFVFLGLIAGREYGFALFNKSMDIAHTTYLALSDASKAFIGLALSINMAIGLPWLAKGLVDGYFDVAALLPSARYGVFLLCVNLLLLPVAYFLKTKSRLAMIMLVVFLGGGVTTFFTVSL